MRLEIKTSILIMYMILNVSYNIETKTFILRNGGESLIVIIWVKWYLIKCKCIFASRD